MSHRCHADHSRQGFTLVELSIVLVILGLLVGGVLAGQSLIRASELRSVGTQFNSFVVARNNFKDKYFGLPGDIKDATTYWGQAAVGAACYNTAGTGTQTCDGDGDGQISSYDPNSNEIFRMWQQLVLAGLIEGQYTGVAGSGGFHHATAANVPRARFNNGFWFLDSWDPTVGLGDLFDNTYGNYLTVGGLSTADFPDVTIFSLSELYLMDQKVDDGKPATGQLVSWGWIPSCTTGATSTDYGADYQLGDTNPGCRPVFRDAI